MGKEATYSLWWQANCTYHYSYIDGPYHRNDRNEPYIRIQAFLFVKRGFFNHVYIVLLWENTHIQRVFHLIASQSMYKESSHHVLLVFVPCIYIVLQCACIDNANNALPYAFHLFVF